MPMNIRILLCIVAIPGIVLLVMQGFSFYLEGWNAQLDSTSLIYGSVSCYLVYLVFSGKNPSFLNNQ